MFHSTVSVYHVCDSHSVVSESLQSLWTVACQAPLFLGFFRQEYWSGLPFPLPGDLPDPGIKLGSPALQADSPPLSHQGSPLLCLMKPCISYSWLLSILSWETFERTWFMGQKEKRRRYQMMLKKLEGPTLPNLRVKFWLIYLFVHSYSPTKGEGVAKDEMVR